MAKINFQIEVDDKKLQDIVKKKHKVAVAVDAQGMKSAIGSAIAKEKVKKQAEQQSDVLGDAIKSVFSSINSIIKSRLATQLISGIKGTIGVITATIGGAVLYAGRAYQRGIEMSLPTATALRSMTTNIPSYLFTNLPNIISDLQENAKAFGVSVSELANALEASLPAIGDYTPQNIKRFSEAFAKLKYLENVSPDEFQVLANVSQITGRSIENIAQIFNVFTDNVGQTGKQVMLELRKLSGDFGWQLTEDMFALLEYYQRYISIDPRENVQAIQKGITDLNKMWQGILPFEKINEEAKRMLEISQTQLYQQIKAKYTEGLGTLQQSYEELMATPPAQFEQFFARQRESLQTAMYNFVMERQPALETAYKNIKRFTTTFFGDYEPIARSLFISPETGMPTMMTAVIPIVEKLTGIHNLVDLIYKAMTVEGGKEYETNTEYWVRQFKEAMSWAFGKQASTEATKAIANYQGAIY